MSCLKCEQRQVSKDQHILKIRTNLDWKHCNFLGRIDIVPDTEVSAVLTDDNVTKRHPLHVGAIVENSGALL